VFNGSDAYLLTPEQLEGLTITPPPGFVGEIPLWARAISTESSGGDTAVTLVDFEVCVQEVDDVAEPPVVTADDVKGMQGMRLPLNINASLTDTDGSESLQVLVRGLPNGASLSAGQRSGQFWVLRADQLEDLQIQPPANFVGEFNLWITGISSESNGETSAATSVDINVCIMRMMPGRRD
jgi:hypothetical protein